MRLKHFLTVLFGSCIAIANVLAAKLVAVPHIDAAVPAGFVAFGVAFLASDLMVEFYGEDYAASVLWSTVATLLIVYGLIWLAIAMPAAVFYDDAAFVQTLSSSGAVTVASIVTIAVSQRLDVWLFDRLAKRTNGRRRWLRNCASTATSQALDTVVFISLAFAVFPALQGGDPMWGMTLVSTIVGQYVVKLAVAALDTPVFYLVTEVVE